MENDKERRMKNDLAYVRERYRVLDEEKGTMFEALDSLFDVATLLPMCEAEYGEKQEFTDYRKIYDILKEVARYLEVYGMGMSIPKILETNMKTAKA